MTSCLNFRSSLLRFNLHTVIWTNLKCTAYDFLQVYTPMWPPEHFHHPRKCPSSQSSQPPSPTPRDNYFSDLLPKSVLGDLVLHRNSIIQHVLFWSTCTQHGICEIINVVACISIVSFFSDGQYSIVWICPVCLSLLLLMGTGFLVFGCFE